MGRPAFNWTNQLEDAICAAIAVTPKGLDHISKSHPDFPSADTIYKHRNDSEDFAVKYARAKASQVLRFADEIIEIADDSSRDMKEVEITEGVKVKQLDREHIERVRIRIDTRKWLASKLAPKIFGDKLAHTGADGEGPIELVVKHIASDGE